MAVWSENKARMLDAALQLATEKAWQDVSLAEIASRAELTLAEAYEAFPSKAAVVAGLVVQADRGVLMAGPADPTEAVRDRLFDVLMRRFDALQARRPGIVAILHAAPRDPLSMLCVGPQLLRGMAWMLEAAGVSSSGLLGALRTKGLAVVYLDAMRAWIDDDTADMAPTMAALDRGLRRCDRIAGSFPLSFWRRHQQTSGATGPARPRGDAGADYTDPGGTGGVTIEGSPSPDPSPL